MKSSISKNTYLRKLSQHFLQGGNLFWKATHQEYFLAYVLLYSPNPEIWKKLNFSCI